MKKETIKFIATATAVVSATALTVNAKADSVTNNSPTENNDKVQTTVTPEQQLKNNVDTTKQALDSASQTQTQAQSKADAANSEVANNQTNVDQAQANVDKAQANQDQATQNLADLNKQNENYDSNLSNAKTNVDNAQTAVTNAQGDVNTQNGVVNNDTQAVNEVNANVNQAQAGVNDAQANVDKAQADLDNANPNGLQKELDATNNTIKEDTQAVTNAQNNLEQAKANDQANDNALAKTQDQVAAQTKVVNNDKQALDDATKALNQAKSNQAQAQTSVDKQAKVVANAQSEVDKTNATDLSNKLNQANSAVTNDTQAVANAQKALDQAKTNDANNAKQVSDKQAKLTDAQNALANAVKSNQNSQADLTSAKNNQASVQADLDAKQKEINNIKSQMGSVNTIVVPSGYTVDKVNQAYANAKKGDTSFAENFFNTVGKNGMTINEYKANAKDIAETVDLKNITPEQQLEINKFAVGLINQVREQLGLPKIVLNQDSMNIAKEVAAGYAEQGEISTFIHDYRNVLDPVAKKHQLDALLENRSWNYYGKTVSLGSAKGNEEYYTDYDNENYVNMAVVKSDIYADILNMLFEDNFDTNRAYGHAVNFLTDKVNVGQDANGNQVNVPLKAIYMGVGITNDDNHQKDLSSFYELITVYDSMEYQTKDDVAYGSSTIYDGLNQNSSTFAYTSSINTGTQNYTQQLKQATNELSAKQTALNEAKQATTQAQAKADSAANALATAQNKVNALTSELNNLKAYQDRKSVV